jgi:hypothetical protein
MDVTKRPKTNVRFWSDPNLRKALSPVELTSLPLFERVLGSSMTISRRKLILFLLFLPNELGPGQ